MREQEKSSGNRFEKVKCPFCGYEMPIFMSKNAKCNGIFVHCKGRGCKKIFEILTK